MRQKRLWIPTILAATSLSLWMGCASDPIESDPTPTPTPTPEADATVAPESNLVLTLDHVFDGEALVMGSETLYTNAAENQLGVMTLQWFLCDVQLHGADGSTVAVDGTHYVDASDGETLRYPLNVEVSAGSWTSVSFVFGLTPDYNVSGAFDGPPESLMEWPDAMGGGYHYMKLEGRFIDAEGAVSSYAVHAGGLDGEDYSIPIELETAIEWDGEALEIPITMDVSRWFDGADAWDLNESYVTGTMADPVWQATIQANGADAFSAQ